MQTDTPAQAVEYALGALRSGWDAVAQLLAEVTADANEIRKRGALICLLDRLPIDHPTRHIVNTVEKAWAIHAECARRDEADRKPGQFDLVDIDDMLQQYLEVTSEIDQSWDLVSRGSTPHGEHR